MDTGSILYSTFSGRFLASRILESPKQIEADGGIRTSVSEQSGKSMIYVALHREERHSSSCQDADVAIQTSIPEYREAMIISSLTKGRRTLNDALVHAPLRGPAQGFRGHIGIEYEAHETRGS